MDQRRLPETYDEIVINFNDVLRTFYQLVGRNTSHNEWGEVICPKLGQLKKDCVFTIVGRLREDGYGSYESDADMWLIEKNGEFLMAYDAPVWATILFKTELDKLFKHYCTYNLNRRDGAEIHLPEIDRLSGSEFENFMSQFLIKQGFKVNNIQATRDKGIDLIIAKGNQRVAAQLKNHHKPIGIDAPQQAFGGKEFYKCTLAAVMSNQEFTPDAVKFAQNTGVVLIGRNQLPQVVRILNEIMNTPS